MDKYVLVSLDDKKSKEMAHAISNETARKILDYLSDVKQASPKKISKELNIALSTVVYNLKQLEKNHLVKKKDFAWSEKGKKVHYYGLAKKLIIIAPKGYDWQESLKKIVPVALVGAFISVLLKVFYGAAPLMEDAEDAAVISSGVFENIFQAEYLWLYAIIITIVTILAIYLYYWKKSK